MPSRLFTLFVAASLSLACSSSSDGGGSAPQPTLCGVVPSGQGNACSAGTDCPALSCVCNDASTTSLRACANGACDPAGACTALCTRGGGVACGSQQDAGQQETSTPPTDTGGGDFCTTFADRYCASCGCTPGDAAWSYASGECGLFRPKCTDAFFTCWTANCDFTKGNCQTSCS